MDLLLLGSLMFFAGGQRAGLTGGRRRLDLPPTGLHPPEARLLPGGKGLGGQEWGWGLPGSCTSPLLDSAGPGIAPGCPRWLCCETVSPAYRERSTIICVSFAFVHSTLRPPSLAAPLVKKWSPVSVSAPRIRPGLAAVLSGQAPGNAGLQSLSKALPCPLDTAFAVGKAW